jgi:MFS superfamily sulfate permease-like transporter
MLLLGVFLAGSIAGLITAFPQAILGVMLLVVAVELIKPACATRTRADLALLAITLACALLINMAAGFVLGIGWQYARKRFTELKLEKNP